MNAHPVVVGLPADLVADVDTLVGADQRGSFVEQATLHEIERRKLRSFIADMRETGPAWKDEDHPELADGSYAYVRRLRAENEKRMEAVEAAWRAE